MRFRLEAKPEELTQKGTELIKALVREFRVVAPETAALLEKALPPPDQTLKFPALQGLADQTRELYARTLEAMLRDIGKVLDQSTLPAARYHDTAEKSEDIDADDVDFLEKSAGHKYLRRIPTTDPKRPWRYVYREDSEHMLQGFHVGEKVRIKHDGKSGHFEVLGHEGDKLKVRHDESGKALTISPGLLRELFHREHNLARTKKIEERSAALETAQVKATQAGRYGYAKYLSERRDQLRKRHDPYSMFTKMVDYAVRHEVIDQAKAALSGALAPLKALEKADRPWTPGERLEFSQGVERAWGESRKLLNDLASDLSRQEYISVGSLDEGPDKAAVKLRAAKIEKRRAALWQKIIDFHQDAIGGIPGGRDPVIFGTRYDVAFNPDHTKANAGKNWRSINQKWSGLIREFEAVHREWAETVAEIKNLEQTKIDPVVDVIHATGGIPIHIHFNAATNDRERAIGQVNREVDQVKRAGFNKALRGLVLHVRGMGGQNALHPSLGTAGEYYVGASWRAFMDMGHERKGDITLYSGSFRDGTPTGVLTHELGHRFYYQQLNENARAGWEEELNKRAMTVTPEESTRLLGELEAMAKADNLEGVKARKAIDHLATQGEAGKRVAQYLVRAFDVSAQADGYISLDTLRKTFANDVSGKRFNQEFITWYGGSNPSEAFAEAFHLYINKGPRAVPEWTRSFFERIVEPFKKSEDDEADSDSDADEDEEAEETEGGEDEEGNADEEEHENPFAASLTKAGGPYIGPRGGKWADPKHTIAWQEPEAAQHEGKYHYGAAMRPVSHANVPKGAEHRPHESFRHGVAVYDRPLTHEEIESYELTPVLNPGATSERVSRALDELHEYADEYRKLLEEDPKIVEVTVRQALERQGPGHFDMNAAVQKVIADLKAGGSTSKPLEVKIHPKIAGQGGAVETYRVVDSKGDLVRLSRHEGGSYGPWMPKESVKHFVNDLAGKVELPKSGRDDIDAVIEGKAEFLGKGDDGLAFKVGNKVVKVSTTVPFQPENPGHRTPGEAADMLKRQVETGNKLADQGIRGVQRSEFVRHGDKGFQIKPWVEIPDKFTAEQLDKIQDTLIAIHKAGYALHDDVQAGLNPDGEPVMFDVGKASPIENPEGKGIFSDVADDMDRLKRLYQASGVPFARKDVDEGAKAWTKATESAAKTKAKGGPKGFAKLQLDIAAKKRREVANATLKGKALADALEDIDIDVEDALHGWPEEIKKAEPFYDFTKPIADRDDRAYQRVKAVLQRKGYSASDFDQGGALYGYSVNELIGLVRDGRGADEPFGAEA